MRFRYCALGVVLGLCVACVSSAHAGMASPLPTNVEQILRLRETPALRLQAISFFLMGLLVCTAIVRCLWNYLRRDFPKMPRLSFGKALAGVFLWGLLFILVLAMISGARELLTPGAWKKEGYTYKLSSSPSASNIAEYGAARKQGLEEIRIALWQFAALHKGRFPTRDEAGQMPKALWEVPEYGGLRYLYVPGLTATDTATILAYEPEIESGRRLVLKTDGSITTMQNEDLDKRVTASVKP